ncbi:hypothetical protein [Myxococcus sp. RHSTA-1-4]|uniref:hypothetical protein n=1 Tax=Myxococcus sp. RHSTA-1-4 TaxID=2874601 RepID=UPI001CBECF73|nr:hypothetical protein [Myxococcus sp. RHSTA-1-4]MBZ4421112.1 hypothetical protein [Myxococcus sp. RHSTA-1-4]
MPRRALRASIILASLLTSTPAAAQQESLCIDALGQDRQPDFTPDSLYLSSVVVVDAYPPALRLDVSSLAGLDSERFILPGDQQLSVSFVSESSSASHALGWFYYDELLQRGYVHPGLPGDPSDDVLADTNGNGIADLHEDLYNLAPPGGPQARPYVGTTRRCTTTFTHNGFVYSEPALAIRGCNPSYVPQSLFTDARPGGTGSYYAASTGVIGATTVTTNDYSDNGLYPRVPNLLEPTHAANGNRGFGNLLFLLVDDDSDTTTYRNLAPVLDRATTSDGIPDYPTSQYDERGVLRPAGNVAAPITAADRTVKTATLQAGREVVFFLISYRDSGSSGVHPCLRYDGTGRCELYLKTPVSVFFSKSLLNLDQNPTASDPVVSLDMGHDQDTCGSWPNDCGWLELPTLERLATPPYSLPLPTGERVSLRRSPSGRMPHALLGKPSTDATRWVLAFEDEHGGGDLDFNDVVFHFQRALSGTVRSEVVTDIPPELQQDFAITRVTFAKDDQPSFEAIPGACGGGTPPRIDYAIAADCKLCDGWDCTYNPNPTWVSVPLTPGMAQADLDLTLSNPYGASLCWKASLTSPHIGCLPTIRNVNIAFQAERLPLATSGTSVVPLGNAFVQAVTRRWSPQSAPSASLRKYDGRRDLSARGHLYLRTLHEPETPDFTQVLSHWDAGQVLSAWAEPLNRRLLTGTGPGASQTLATDLAEGNSSSVGFSTAQLCTFANGLVYDLNRDGLCDTRDRGFLRDWLYGYESRTSSTSIRRAWTLGAFRQSTPALLTPPRLPASLQHASPEELAAFQVYAGSLQNRPTVSFVGSASGFLHAFFAGRYVLGDDACTPEVEADGYFLPSAGCGSPRLLGDGMEMFAWSPRKLLSKFAPQYVGYGGQDALVPSLDAPPAISEVDLGGTSAPWTYSSTPGVGAKTVVVSTSARGPGVAFALDVSNPDGPSFPLPLWEYALADVNAWFWPTNLRPDTLGSRHPPVVTRVMPGQGAPRWVTLVATDFVPSTGTAGALYMLDLATGLPLRDGPTGKWTGVIPFVSGQGLAAEPVPVDVDSDGSTDVLYVPTTDGGIYRVNLRESRPERAPARAFGMCRVAHVPGDLAPILTGQRVDRQRLHSRIAARVERDELGQPTVRLFVTTGDNPDVADPVADEPADQYLVLAYEDSQPLASEADCGTSRATLKWYFPLYPGEVAWGGVTLDGDSVLLATSVGTSTAACSLSPDRSGGFLRLNQAMGFPMEERQFLGGHFPRAPVVHGGRIILVGADGTPWIRDAGGWTH